MAGIEENIKRIGGLRPVRTEQFDPLTEAELLELERTMGARLPETYRSFLATYGICGFERYVDYTTIEPTQPYISNDTRTGHTSYFYGRAANGSQSVIWMFENSRDRMPETIIPIGDDLMGNQTCIGIAGPERGKLYYWDHDDEPDEDNYIRLDLPVPPNLKFRNVHLIANSFEEFFDQMFVREDV